MELAQIEFSVLGMKIVTNVVEIELSVLGVIFLAMFIGQCIYSFRKKSLKEDFVQSLVISSLFTFAISVIFAILLLTEVLPNTW